MEFFKQYFHDINFDEVRGEVKVLCPFHHDSKPSATVNKEKGLFHCWVCNTGYNEEQFMAEVKGIPVSQAVKLLSEMHNHMGADWDVSFKAELWADDEVLEAVRALGFTDEFTDAVGLGLGFVGNDKTLAYPILFDGVLMDVRRYNILKVPKLNKVTSERGAKSGWIYPYDLWKKDTNTTYIFEGEKDALMARQLGLNAITLTGGATAKPNEFCLPTFKDRDVIICYDNDDAGQAGALNLCNILAPIANSVGTVDIGQLVKEDKEDFHDYIAKYDGDVFDFMLLPVTPFEAKVSTKEYTKINRAMKDSILRKELNSQVIVTSEFVDAYSVPTIIQAVKLSSSGDNDQLDVGTKLYWTLDDENIHEILPLIEVDAKAKNVMQHAMELVKVPKKEQNVSIELKDDQFVYRCMVTDKDTDGSSMALDLYSFEKLQVGSQYDVSYKLYAHPNKNQRIVAIATNIVSHDDKDDYVPDVTVLKMFQKGETIGDKVKNLFQSARHHVAKHMDFDIWFMSDLVFNSILDFKYGDVMRGALDIFMLGDTQVGKSETTSHLVSLYNFGHFLSLKTSTTVGLIGGSNKVEGSWANTIGAIPRQHKKLAVLEEFSGANPDFIKTMTDIRSSNEVRLTRASGELRAPCKLRMITISNPINDDNGNPRFLSSFPNGVIPIMELVKSAEDVARYDGFILTPKKDARQNPFENALVGEPVEKTAYEKKAQWVYTRRAEHVVFADGVESYIWDKAEEMNAKFECNVPIFGTTTSKKLARFAVALASLVVNTDESYEKVVVTKEIVDYIVDFLDKNYSSSQFRLDVVKKEWESFSNYTKEDVLVVEDLYPTNATMLEFLANQSRTTRANLQSISGKDRDGFSTVFNALVRYKLVRINMESVYPTEKFRKIYAIMRKTVGEMVNKHAKVDYDL